MYIKRAICKSFFEKLNPNKVIVLLGARRVGKTSFIREEVLNKLTDLYLVLNGDDMLTLEVLKLRSIENYKSVLGSNKVLIIDEAQKIPDIGLILKLIVDHIEGIKIIATGSSVFDLANKLGEPLTGRKHTFFMYPLSQSELAKEENFMGTKAKLEERLIYGSYPELVKLHGNKEKAFYLNEMVSSYLLKDILEFDGIKNSSKMLNLLKLIAFQIGKEVSIEELGRQLGLSRNTVERYLDLLTKVFIITRVGGFSRNLRTEIVKTSKWYFFDNGIRNALIANLNPLSLRNDTGELWENYLISERIKHQHYTGMLVNNYFWRTYQMQEIDFIEEREGKQFAYEIKWNMHKKVNAPSAWKEAYKDSEFRVITPDNYLDWIT